MVNYKKVFLFEFYALSTGKDDNEGLPADPYNLRAEWGRQRTPTSVIVLIVGSNIPLPFRKFSVMPFLNALRAGALQHYQRPRYLWRWKYQPTAGIVVKSELRQLQRNKPGLRSGIRLLQFEPSTRYLHRAQLGPRPSELWIEFALVEVVVLRRHS